MKKLTETPIIFVSYFCGINGMVMAEWADDKLRVLSSLEKKVYVITSLYSVNNIQGDFIYLRVPSFSWRDFQREVLTLKNRNQKLSFWHYLFFPVALTFGRLYDLLTKKWINFDNPARWSWGFSALPLTLYLIFRQRGSVIFATGGATGGHLLGLFANLISKIPVYFEFQDPLMGSEIKRSDLNSNLISKLERLFIKRSVRTVFVTKSAALSSIERHPQLRNQIVSIYPGAWRFIDLQSNTNLSSRHVIELLHLGTLYGARNLNNFFLALDNLRESGCSNADRVCVKNLGDIYLENKDDYLDRTDFELLAPQQRSEALRRALDSDALLLIQHADSRSNETIPYKTYDYLNLKKPIIGVINNPELSILLDVSSNYLADASSVDSIQETLKRFLSEFDLNREDSATFKNNFDINKQFEKVFE